MAEAVTMQRREGGRKVITAEAVRSSDPCVYVDPYPGAHGGDLIKEPCGKCGGDGMFHAPSGWFIQNPYGKRGEAIKGCFDCRGVGHRIIKVSSVRARVRRHVKAAIQGKAEAAEYAARADERAAEEFAQAWDEAHAEQQRRAALNNEPVGEIGERIKELAGVVEVAITKEVPGYRYGTDIKRLVVIKLNTGQVVKTFGSARNLFEVQRGDQVTITGATIKEIEPYQGQVQTVVTRLAMRVDDATLRPDDIAEGDEIESEGSWYPVLRADRQGVTVRVELGERQWNSTIRYHNISGHRRVDNH